MEEKTSQFEQLTKDVTQYVNLRIDALKLRLIKNLSVFFSVLFSALIGVLLLNLALLFLLGALTFWIATLINSMIGAMCITGGFFLLLIILVIVFRRKLVTDRLVAMFSKMFFDGGDDEANTQNTKL